MASLLYNFAILTNTVYHMISRSNLICTKFPAKLYNASRDFLFFKFCFLN